MWVLEARMEPKGKGANPDATALQVYPAPTVVQLKRARKVRNVLSHQILCFAMTLIYARETRLQDFRAS